MDNPEQAAFRRKKGPAGEGEPLSANPTKQAHPGPLFWIDSTLVFPGKLS